MQSRTSTQEEQFLGRSHLLGNRKGLAGLKNKETGDKSGLHLGINATGDKNRFAETLEREGTSFLHNLPLLSVSSSSTPHRAETSDT